MGSFYNHFILVLLLLALLTPISSFAGFSKLTAKKAAPLKPKAMWDRYLSLTKVPLAGDVKVANVAVQFENKWFRTGSVCFQSACSLDYALMRSKRLVAEHARRLYPVEIPKDYEASLGVNFENLSKGETTVNWEQFSSQISKEVFEETISKDLDHCLGFEGVEDPKSGYYCLYDKGKLVDTDISGKKEQVSKEGLRKSNR
ncbi:hypothetical protein ScalyP_jg2087 [Parmales sp. scaly parma]|nr:hypothetical protein ScalyP_jg2087 [Parmales sp. scaly parma]